MNFYSVSDPSVTSGGRRKGQQTGFVVMETLNERKNFEMKKISKVEGPGINLRGHPNRKMTTLGLPHRWLHNP